MARADASDLQLGVLLTLAFAGDARPGRRRVYGFDSLSSSKIRRSRYRCSGSKTNGGDESDDSPSKATPLGDTVRETGCPLTAGIWVSLDTTC